MNKHPVSTIAGLALVATCLLLQNARATVSLPFYDGYAYDEGILNNVGSPTWVAGSGTSTYEIAVSNAAALTSPSGFATASGKGVRRAPSGSARRSVLQYTSVPAVDGNTVYVSFLLDVQTAPGGTQLIGFLDDHNSSQGSPQAGIFLDGSSRVGIGKKSSTPGFTTSSGLSVGTHLIVVCYTFQAGDNKVDLWVDPSSAYYGAATPPGSLGSVTGGTEPPSLDYFQIYTPGTAGGVQFLDEFRVGTTWASVTSAGTPVVGSQLGFTTQPSDTVTNQTMTPAVVVQIQDSDGAAAASNGVPITLSLFSGTATLSGTTTQNTDATGKATFNDLSLDTVDTGYQFLASASGIGAGLAAAVSDTFDILTAPVVTGLVFTQAMLTANGVAMAGSGGTANAFYQVLGATDLATPVSQWILVNYANFDSAGRFAITNPFPSILPSVFYRVCVGSTGTKISAPAIQQQPASQTVSAGQTATIYVDAAGDAPLVYQWYFNGAPIPNGTGATLTLLNVQAGDEGNYSVAVANPAGQAVSATATLRVGDYGPSIVTEPGDQEVIAGGTAIFHVVADGTIPLVYQWYYNTNTLLTDATNAQLTLNNVDTNQAGTYAVTITNTFGSITSRHAVLTVNESPTGSINTNLLGFAAVVGVTGGAGGSVVTASTYAELRAYLRQSGSLIVQITNMLTANESYTYVLLGNKTILGVGTNAGLNADLRINTNNVIVANLFIHGPTNDGITIDTGSHGTGSNIWVDHCTFYDCGDGSLDITKGADYITVSWCKFYYAGHHSHEYVNLIGSSDSDDASQYHVTFHHNWYGDFCSERMPSVRFGRVHVFNNYYSCSGNNYCVRTRINAQVLVENNYYIGVQNPWERFVTSGNPGLLRATGNITNNCTFISGWTSGAVLIPGTDTLSDLNPPPYSYTLDEASVVPFYVQNYAGSGKYPHVSP